MQVFHIIDDMNIKRRIGPYDLRGGHAPAHPRAAEPRTQPQNIS